MLVLHRKWIAVDGELRHMPDFPTSDAVARLALHTRDLDRSYPHRLFHLEYMLEWKSAHGSNVVALPVHTSGQNTTLPCLRMAAAQVHM